VGKQKGGVVLWQKDPEKKKGRRKKGRGQSFRLFNCQNAPDTLLPRKRGGKGGGRGKALREIMTIPWGRTIFWMSNW